MFNENISNINKTILRKLSYCWHSNNMITACCEQKIIKDYNIPFLKWYKRTNRKQAGSLLVKSTFN